MKKSSEERFAAEKVKEIMNFDEIKEELLELALRIEKSPLIAIKSR